MQKYSRYPNLQKHYSFRTSKYKWAMYDLPSVCDSPEPLRAAFYVWLQWATSLLFSSLLVLETLPSLPIYKTFSRRATNEGFPEVEIRIVRGEM